MVLTEKAREDFESSFANPKAFKLFSKMYKQVQGNPKKSSTSRSSSYSRSSTFSRSRRSAFLPYRTNRNSTRSQSRSTANRRSNPTRRASGVRRSGKSKSSSKLDNSSRDNASR